MRTFLYRNLAAFTDTCFAALFATVCYFATIFLFYQIIPYGIMIFFIVYLCLPLFFKGKSIGKILFHIEIEYDKNAHNQNLLLFLREIILKIILFTVVPYFVLVIFLHYNEYLSILYVGVVSALVNNIVYLLGKKRYIWDYLTRSYIVQKQPVMPKSSSHPHKSSKFMAALIDVSIIIALSTICYLTLQQWIFIKFHLIVLVIAWAYFVFFYSIFQNTIGKQIAGITINFNSTKSRLYTVFVRETIKFAPLVLLLVLFKVVRLENDFCNLVFIIFLQIYVLMWSIAQKKACYWDILAHTIKLKKVQKFSRKLVWRLSLLLFYVISFFGVKMLNNIYPSDNVSFMGFNLYLYNKHYPVDKNAQAKIDFINTNPVSAKDYVLQLFDKYDIVVLGERNHDEMTQYDLFYDIVSDTLFIQRVGHIFTENDAPLP